MQYFCSIETAGSWQLYSNNKAWNFRYRELQIEWGKLTLDVVCVKQATWRELQFVHGWADDIV